MRCVNHLATESNHPRVIAGEGYWKTTGVGIKADTQKRIRLRPSVLKLIYKRGSHTKDYAKPQIHRHFSAKKFMFYC
jgi:hypothetical protein